MELGISRRNLTLALTALVLVYVVAFGTRRVFAEVGAQRRLGSLGNRKVVLLG
jgi:hypothetical protein